MPRASCRRSVITAFASLCASPTMALARWGSLWIVFLAMPRVIARPTRRGCTPSCRSRSIRSRSWAAASTAPWRRSASSATCSRRSSCEPEIIPRARPRSARAPATRISSDSSSAAAEMAVSSQTGRTRPASSSSPWRTAMSAAVQEAHSSVREPRKKTPATSIARWWWSTPFQKAAEETSSHRSCSQPGKPVRRLHDLWLEVSSAAFWKGVLHHHLAMLVAGVFFLGSLTLLWASWTAADIAVRHGELELAGRVLPVWLLTAISAAALLLSLLILVAGALADRGLARGMISGSQEDLREQVAELAERRQGAVDAAAQERLRIERDLHDGVQPRLVGLAMTLGMARNTIHSDPHRASAMVGEAHSEAKAVMTDLRQLARGIHPAVLTDRGLEDRKSVV